jgi:hypothetical protein
MTAAKRCKRRLWVELRRSPGSHDKKTDRMRSAKGSGYSEGRART